MAQFACVGAGLDVPLPRATAVERHAADIPSASFPGVWQQGELDGFAYRIFPNETALVLRPSDVSRWRIEVVCNLADSNCTRKEVGSVPDGATSVAKSIGDCLTPLPEIRSGPKPAPAPLSSFVSTDPGQEHLTVAENGTLLPEKPAATIPDVAAETAIPAIQPPHRKDAAEHAESPTGSSPLPKATAPSPNEVPACATPSSGDSASAIRAIQRLLTESGRDPGPIDGVKGKRTTRALAEAIGVDAANGNDVSALISLIAMICSGQ